jgi:acetyltransferase-like isoleucine patch superfamily enzyme
MNRLIHHIYLFFSRLINHSERKVFESQLGLLGDNAFFVPPKICTCPRKVFLHQNASILDGAIVLINANSENGKFIMKKNSGASQNLTVITGNHQRIVSHWFKEFVKDHTHDEDKDVIVEEDVWLGANVTLMAGVTIGRGATVGAGSICAKSIPPYSIVMGNPAKVVGFNFNPEQIVEHERNLYPEEERIPFESLEKNYKKYFLDKVSEIKSFTKI